MSKTFLVARRLAVVPLVLVLVHCRPKSVEDQVAALPELPPDLAATLDPKTLATKVVAGPVGPVTRTGESLAPCCSSSETRSLKVRFRYIKCGPPDHLFDLDQAVLSQERRGSGEPAKPAGPELYKLSRLPGLQIPLHFCRVSDGPWNAILTASDGCNTQPIRTLFIAAFGDIVSFTWVGTASPPANVQVLACRQDSFTQAPCGDQQGCDCSSSTCPPDQPCPCALELPSS